MSQHSTIVAWTRAGAVFTDNRYSRAHSWRFDGGVTVPASSSPHSVPGPYSDAANVDPEEAFVAALSSCHMLWFLSIAAKQQFVVDEYRDEAIGVMEKTPDGKTVMTRVTLSPHVVFSGACTPTDADVAAMHHAAHETCFLANSVKTEIVMRGTWSIQNA